MKTFKIGDVACGDCRMCCTNDTVVVAGDEYGYELEPGTSHLARKADKTCIYLVDSGCSIYERRPRICRDFDCRWLAAKIPEAQVDGLRIRDTWKRGRELLNA